MSDNTPIPHKTCPRCDGRGTIWRNSRSVENSYGGRAVDCPRCNGGGTVPYTLAELRRIALGAVRSELREAGKQPEMYKPHGAWIIIGDIATNSPDTLAAWWYFNTGSDQARLFRQDWTRWANETRGRQ